MKQTHKDFLTTIESYVDSVSLNPKDNNESFSKRLDNFKISPTTTNFYNLLMASTSIEIEKRHFMVADTISINISEDNKVDFLPLSSIEKSSDPAKTGEIILWCAQPYIVGKVNGDSAEVFDFDGLLESNDFKFNYENEPHYIIGIKESLVEDVSKYEIYETPDVQPDLFAKKLKEILEKSENEVSVAKKSKRNKLK